MSKIAGGIGGGVLAAALLGVSNVASAQVIVFAPAATSVPTMSEWMLIVMSLLIAAAAFRVMRAREMSRPLAWLLSVGVLAAGASAGLQLAGEAKASGFSQLTLSTLGGGSIALPGPGAFGILNSSGVSQRVTSINSGGFTLQDVFGFAPTCAIGLVVQSGNFCYIFNTGGAG